MLFEASPDDPSVFQVRLQLASIVVTTFNRPDYLEQAIRSGLEQTYPRIEVVVVDDGSTPENRAAAEAMVAAFGDARVRYVHKDNGGPASARNVGVDQCQGAYVKFLDDDDTLEPDAIWRYVLALESAGADMAIGARRFMSPEGVKWNVNYRPQGGMIHRPLKMFFRLVIKPQQGLYCFRRAVFDTVRWDDTLRAREDTDLLGRAFAAGATVAGAPDAVLNQRYHTGPRTSGAQFRSEVYAQIHQSNERLFEVLEQTGQLEDCGWDFSAALTRTALRLWPIDREMSEKTYALALRANPNPPLHIDHVGSWKKAVAKQLWRIGGFPLTARVWAMTGGRPDE